MFITKWEKKLYTLIFIACAIFLGYNWAFLNGALDERKKTDCLTPYQLMRWDESMDFSDEILDGFLSSQSDTIKKAEEEIEYWKRNYFWLKEQQNSETINN